jgi:hypothetical protein
MKAKEIKDSIYDKLVSLNYSRKENDLESVNSLNWFDLDPELKDVILTFPNYLISFDVDLMDIEDLNREQQFYLFLSEGKVYLVDTQGYNYPRYIVELEGFDDEEGTFERMEGLLRISDDIIIENAIKSIVIDFSKEGFDKDDVETFLQMRIEFLIKQAIASKLNLFQ